MNNEFKRALDDLSRMKYNGAVMLDGLCKEFIKMHEMAITDALNMCSIMRENQIMNFEQKADEYFRNV